MSDRSLRQSVLDELEFEPAVDATKIGVAVDNGVVTLTGHVSSYAEKIAAERAVQRVKGVRGVAEEIEVRYPSERRTTTTRLPREPRKSLTGTPRFRPARSRSKSKKGGSPSAARSNGNFSAWAPRPRSGSFRASLVSRT